MNAKTLLMNSVRILIIAGAVRFGVADPHWCWSTSSINNCAGYPVCTCEQDFVGGDSCDWNPNPDCYDSNGSTCTVYNDGGCVFSS